MILTPDQRLRVFVSSTLQELAPERAAVRTTIERLRLAPVMFELAARPHPPRALYRAYLEQSHIFIGLYWQSYGWTAEDMTISGLEDEYRLSGSKPRLIYVKEPAENRDPQLAGLLSEIGESGVSYRRFTTLQELADLVANDLAMILTEHFTGPQPQADEEPRLVDKAQLPVFPTSFVGREREVAQVQSLLTTEGVRLVTLIGAGGIGKSRLAVEAARGLADAFADGVRLVTLAQVTEPDLVIPTIAHQLGIRAEDQHVQHSGLIEALRDRSMLLILDNFEQVVEAATEVAVLLERCPSLKVIVTSRRVLHVRGEYQFAVGRLDVPPDVVFDEHDLLAAEAAELFLQRARAVRPQLHLPQHEVQAIADLVRRLDGVPLAIELAAARSRLLPPSMLLAKISTNLDVLDGALKDLPDRQRSVRATLDWSFDLLSEPEQMLFARLSTFAGSFSLEAAEDICGAGGSEELDTLEHLSSLVESSLVVVEGHDPIEPRFRLLNPVREYAHGHLERSGMLAEMEQRHTEYYTALCQAASEQLLGPTQHEWLEILEQETGNLNAAARRLVDDADYVGIVSAAWRLWPWLWLRGHMTEARFWLSAPLVAAESIPAQERGRLVWLMGSCMFEQGDYDDARQLLDWAADLFEEVGDTHGGGLVDLMRGSLAAGDGDLDRTTQLYAGAVAALQANGDHFSAAVAGSSLGLHTMMNRGDAEGADRYLAAALADALAISNEPMVRMARLYQGFADLVRADLAGAEQRLRAVVRAGADGRTDEILSYALDGLASVSLGRGDAARAATLMGAGAGLRERRGLSSWPLTRNLLDALVQAVRSQLSPQDFDIAWAAGHALNLVAARAFALDEEPARSSADR